MAGVSTYTVSSVVNSKAKVSAELTARVQSAVRELNYTPSAIARSLPLRKTRTIGLLIPDIANFFYAKVVRGVEDRLSAAGYSVILGGTYNRPEEQSRYVNLFRAHQVDGLLMFAAGGDDEARSFMEEQGPVVFLGREPAYPADIVSGDNRATLKLAVDHLATRGHTRIAILCGPLALSTNAERVEGWRIAMRANGLEAPAHLIGAGDWTGNAR
jgi:DNA-binding LacI/PurR family transcriptional regulator